MIDPNIQLKDGDRISLPYQLVNDIYALLGDLPARQSMGILLQIQQEADIVEVEDKED